MTLDTHNAICALNLFCNNNLNSRRMNLKTSLMEFTKIQSTWLKLQILYQLQTVSKTTLLRNNSVIKEALCHMNTINKYKSRTNQGFLGAQHIAFIVQTFYKNTPAFYLYKKLFTIEMKHLAKTPSYLSNAINVNLQFTNNLNMFIYPIELLQQYTDAIVDVLIPADINVRPVFDPLDIASKITINI